MRIKVGDVEAHHVVGVIFNGELDNHKWVMVDTTENIGTRFVDKEDGTPVIEDDSFVVETVEGEFEIIWSKERQLPT